MNKASNIITIKGQPAAVTFEADINAFRGKFLNVNGYCDFVATSIEALYREGESALDRVDCGLWKRTALLLFVKKKGKNA